MRAAQNTVANQRILSTHHLRKYLLHHFTAAVAVSVTGGSGKMAFTNVVLNKRRQYFLLVILRNGINIRQYLTALFQCFVRCVL